MTRRESRSVNSMLQLSCIRSTSLPRLAWCAVLGENNNNVNIYHGPWVEVDESSVVEGAWSGPYSEMGFSHAVTFTGSGLLLTPDGVLFSTPTHSVEALYVLRAEKRLHCSNSLSLVLLSAADDIDHDYLYYDVDIMSVAFGLKRSISRIPTRRRNWVTILRYCNFLIDRELSLQILTKKRADPFANYMDYRRFLERQVLSTVRNSSDPRRLVRYTALSTISTGYDSAAVSVIAKAAGCRECITFISSEAGTNDSGKLIAHMLGLEATEYDPAAYCSREDLPEAEFVATGGGGGSVIFTALESRLPGKLLLTGNYGGEAWERANNKGGANMATWDSAGADMLYFRTRVGFLHLAVPSIGYSEYASLHRITTSQEMQPWSLGREEYDRPIPRRIIEEAGVTRALFGQHKKAAARSLKYCNPVSVKEPDLKQVMAATSYLHFCGWADQIKLYRSGLDRLIFTLMHGLYRLNDRVIRSKRCQAAAKRLGIVLPPVPWLPIRFRKRRTSHRLLFHWGINQIKSQHAAGDSLSCSQDFAAPMEG
jgi:hypothetical protein